jgi:hypothetical protein
MSLKKITRDSEKYYERKPFKEKKKKLEEIFNTNVENMLKTKGYDEH